MRSLWSDVDAAALLARCGGSDADREVVLRVYTARLLGGAPRLVLHGGGNVSLKTEMPDLFGDPCEVLCIKGSGRDMATLETADLPALRLAPLRRLREREALSDEDMVRFLRASLIDPAAPNASVETLLHAFLPHKFIDHTHSSAILSLTDQPDGTERIADLYGTRIGIVPYIMPGLGLAKEAVEIFEAAPDVEGLILLKHGVVSFGETAREAYERMIELVTLAERCLAQGRRRFFAAAALPAALPEPAEIAPILRGACALPNPSEPGSYRRFMLDFRDSEAVLNLVKAAHLPAFAQVGVATPDHTIRTKNYPLILPAPEHGRLDEFADSVHEAVGRYVAAYHEYFARHNAAPNRRCTAAGTGMGRGKRELDPAPRVILVPGLGLFGLGRTARDAAIAADIAESWVGTVTDAEAVGRFQSLSEAELFEVEYWSLEQAKLGNAADPPLAGQVAVVTGGAGTIGMATARTMRAAGAEIALIDRGGSNVDGAAEALGGFGIVADVTDPAAMREAFDKVALHFGGVDIVVSNAGAAWQGRIGDVDEEILRASFELNFFAHQWVAQNAVRIMLAQKTGGCLLFNVSRQAVNQGPEAGPYGLPKAATLFLTKQYALEYARDGIRSNAVNADGIRGGLLTPEFIRSRAAAYGLSDAQYMSRNLLRREVTADDVAQSFLHLALARNTTGTFVAVDGGNIAAAPR